MQSTNEGVSRPDAVCYVVNDEHTLGYVYSHAPRWMGVLASSILLGGGSLAPMRLAIIPGLDELRPATALDFYRFRVVPPRKLPIEQPNATPIQCDATGTIEVAQYVGNAEQRETVKQAISTFGHLVKKMARNHVSFADVADAIQQHGVMDSQAVDIVQTLRTLHQMNTLFAGEREVPARDAYDAMKAANEAFRCALVRVYGARDAGEARHRQRHEDPAVQAAAVAFQESVTSYVVALKIARAKAASQWRNSIPDIADGASPPDR